VRKTCSACRSMASSLLVGVRSTTVSQRTRSIRAAAGRIRLVAMSEPIRDRRPHDDHDAQGGHGARDAAGGHGAQSTSVLPAVGGSARVRVHHLLAAKERGERLTMLTSYDVPTARIFDAAGIDLLLVGDSYGDNILGHA